MSTPPVEIRPHRSTAATPGSPASRAARFALVARLALAATGFAACADQTTTGPRVAPARQSASPTRDPLAGRLPSSPGACLVAVQTSTGQYHSRAVNIALPASLGTGSGRVVRVGYRGWRGGSENPARLAVCTIPDTPPARAYVARMFRADVVTRAQLRQQAQLAGVTGATAWEPGVQGPPRAGEPAQYVIDGVVTGDVTTGASTEADGATAGDLAAAVTACGRDNSGCGGGGSSGDPIPAAVYYCAPGTIVPVDGCTLEEEVPPAPGDPPPPLEQEPQPGATYTVLPGGGGLTMSLIDYTCDARVYYPIQTHTGALGLSAPLETFCTAGPVYAVGVSGNMQRRRFLIGIPWHITVGTASYRSAPGYGPVIAAVIGTCNGRGWYRTNAFSKIFASNRTDNYVSSTGWRQYC